MSIEFRCVACNASLVVNDNLAGSRMNCPECGQQIGVPRGFDAKVNAPPVRRPPVAQPQKPSSAPTLPAPALNLVPESEAMSTVMIQKSNDDSALQRYRSFNGPEHQRTWDAILAVGIIELGLCGLAPLLTLASAGALGEFGAILALVYVPASFLWFGIHGICLLTMRASHRVDTGLNFFFPKRVKEPKHVLYISIAQITLVLTPLVFGSLLGVTNPSSFS
jgi:ribosomal protein S27E